MAQPIEVTTDGWIVTSLQLFRTLTENTPPRSWGYWDQIREDVHEPKIIGMWVTGFGLIAAGAATGSWMLCLCAIPPLFLWVRLARSVIRGIRIHPVATGVVDVLEPHPIVPAILMVSPATQSSGEQVKVAAELPLAWEMERAGTPAEVWFVDDPTFDYRVIFAARPVRPRPAAGDEPSREG